MEEKKNVYVPKTTARERTFKGKNDEQVTIIALSFRADDLFDFVSQHTNAKGYVNFDIVRRKEVGQFGDTHSVVLNDYVKKEVVEVVEDDGLPF